MAKAVSPDASCLLVPDKLASSDLLICLMKLCKAATQLWLEIMPEGARNWVLHSFASQQSCGRCGKVVSNIVMVIAWDHAASAFTDCVNITRHGHLDCMAHTNTTQWHAQQLWFTDGLTHKGSSTRFFVTLPHAIRHSGLTLHLD